MKYSFLIFNFFFFFSGLTAQTNAKVTSSVFISVLGTIQDGGSPHMGCKNVCCAALFENPDSNRKVVSLGLIDTKNNKKYLFEASPDITTQLKALKKYLPENESETPDGIFLTHAHIGHYTGLMFLGKEALNTHKAQVYAMPKMNSFLSTNGPWDQLVNNNNIQLISLQNEDTIVLSQEINISPILVPHRDEYSETVGYRINGPNKSALFIPDIDKWEKWNKNIVDEIKKVDYAFLDATFYSGEEINSRDITQIPHPFVIESLIKFEKLSAEDKKKIIFIHFNHTNPIIDINSEASKNVIKKGFHIAQIHDIFEL